MNSHRICLEDSSESDSSVVGDQEDLNSESDSSGSESGDQVGNPECGPSSLPQRRVLIPARFRDEDDGED